MPGCWPWLPPLVSTLPGAFPKKLRLTNREMGVFQLAKWFSCFMYRNAMFIDVPEYLHLIFTGTPVPESWTTCWRFNQSRFDSTFAKRESRMSHTLGHDASNTWNFFAHIQYSPMKLKMLHSMHMQYTCTVYFIYT